MNPRRLVPSMTALLTISLSAVFAVPLKGEAQQTKRAQSSQKAKDPFQNMRETRGERYLRAAEKNKQQAIEEKLRKLDKTKEELTNLQKSRTNRQSKGRDGRSRRGRGQGERDDRRDNVARARELTSEIKELERDIRRIKDSPLRHFTPTISLTGELSIGQIGKLQDAYWYRSSRPGSRSLLKGQVEIVDRYVLARMEVIQVLTPHEGIVVLVKECDRWYKGPKPAGLEIWFKGVDTRQWVTDKRIETPKGVFDIVGKAEPESLRGLHMPILVFERVTPEEIEEILATPAKADR